MKGERGFEKERKFENDKCVCKRYVGFISTTNRKENKEKDEMNGHLLAGSLLGTSHF